MQGRLVRRCRERGFGHGEAGAPRTKGRGLEMGTHPSPPAPERMREFQYRSPGTVGRGGGA